MLSERTALRQSWSGHDFARAKGSLVTDPKPRKARQNVWHRTRRRVVDHGQERSAVRLEVLQGPRASFNVGELINSGEGLLYAQRGWLRQAQIASVPCWVVTDHGRRVIEGSSADRRDEADLPARPALVEPKRDDYGSGRWCIHLRRPSYFPRLCWIFAKADSPRACSIELTNRSLASRLVCRFHDFAFAAAVRVRQVPLQSDRQRVALGIGGWAPPPIKPPFRRPFLFPWPLALRFLGSDVIHSAVC